jgi:nucleoside 2-deoxyribosyltransferase
MALQTPVGEMAMAGRSGTCFVIQPFDGATYDKRYHDVFGPAIEAADLEPYRVDLDPSASVPIEQIESGIRRADICFAEISSDNPNVWFELGYAIASNKAVVMVCAEDRRTRFPFDVQHRAIIKYKTESTSDFSSLGSRITERLKATLKKQLDIGSAAALSPLKETEGLSPHEVVGLVTIAESTDAPDDWIAAHSVRQDMQRAGYTAIAVTLALRSLLRKSMVEVRTDQDYNGNEFVAYAATDRGIEWLENHQDQLVLERKPQGKGPRGPSPFDDDEDLPF